MRPLGSGRKRITAANVLLAFVTGTVGGAATITVIWSARPGYNPADTPLVTNAAPPPAVAATPAMTGGPGLTNFHRVSETLYRGSQPTAGGVRRLKEMGFKTIVSLRHVRGDMHLIGETGIGYERIYVHPLAPQTQQIIRFLQIATDPSRQPVFVHCQRGADRTGMMVAAYRVTVQGWETEEAVIEWTEGGFGYSKYLRHLVKFFRGEDLDDIRTRAGLDIPRPDTKTQAPTVPAS